MEGYPWVAEAEGEPIEGPYMICYKQYHKRQSDAILADIIDYDELLTGKRNEATFTVSVMRA